MPFNGSGVYSPPSLPGSFNPATTGQQATPADWNTLLADLATALSTTLTRDGQSTVTADISLDTHKLTDVAPATLGTDAVNLTQAMAFSRSAPVVKTANFTIADTDIWLINNKTGSDVIVTLPAAASSVGRALTFLTYQAFNVASSLSNIIGVAGGAPNTSIVPAIGGAWTTIVCDGTNWRKTQVYQ